MNAASMGQKVRQITESLLGHNEKSNAALMNIEADLLLAVELCYPLCCHFDATFPSILIFDNLATFRLADAILHFMQFHKALDAR